jgi:hypothetical protein
VLRGIVTKAVAVDDRGRVYIAVTQGYSGVGSMGEPRGTVPYLARRGGDRQEGDSGVIIYDEDLRHFHIEIAADNCEGVAVTREGGSLVLYTTERHGGILKRWKLTESGGSVTDAVLDGLAGEGEMRIPGAKDLRQIFIDHKGRLWISDKEANLVHRVERNRKDVKSVGIPTPMGIAADGDRYFVTRFIEREITILDDDMKSVGTLSVPWEQLVLSPVGNNNHGALSGIVSVPGKGFYVCNERGQTANQRSTYGIKDSESGKAGPKDSEKFYNDFKHDDNDPILHATPVSAVAE